jgi:hypothetical protein
VNFPGGAGNALEFLAAKHGCTRSEAVRRLAKLGLVADKKGILEQ